MVSDLEHLKTRRVTLGKVHQKAICVHVGATALCLLALFWVMQLWRADLSVPLMLEGDVSSHSALVKGMLENGWYLRNRFLGMPWGLDFSDYPMADGFHFLLIKVMSFWTSDHALLINLYYLLGFPLTVMTSLLVFRRFGLSYPPAIVGSLLFAFLPYHFMRGTWHLFLSSYYLIPLIVMVVLWICLDEPLFRDAKVQRGALWGRIYPKGAASIAFCVLVASGGAYYAFFAGYFLLVAGAFAFFQRRSRAQLLASLVLSAVLFLTFLINVSPSIIHAYQQGKNPSAVVRSPVAAEIFGMRITQLLLPVRGHRVSYLAKLKEAYARNWPHVNENDTVSLGIVGGLGFLTLLGWLVIRKPEVGNPDLTTGLAILNIAAVLLATIGGFGSLLALAITNKVRAYNRISVYIAFFSLFAVALLLDEMVRRWRASRTGRYLSYGVLGFILFVGIMDQTTLHFIRPYELLKAEYLSDDAFVKRIEASVPKDAMIFQLPHVPFPEYPHVHRMGDYALLRGYLHSRSLRWSYGAMKGRDGDAWQRSVARKPVTELVSTLAFAGFSGIYVDRYGYADGGAKLEAELQGVLDTKPIVSANKRLTFFSLAEFNQALRKRYTAEQWQSKHEATLYPLRLEWKGGFSGLEGTPERNWRWCASKGELYITNPLRRDRRVLLDMTVATGHRESSLLKVDSPWFSEELKINIEGRLISKKARVQPGTHVIRFESDARRVHAPGDPRVLVFSVQNFHLEEQH